MKKILLIMCMIILATGCSKEEETEYHVSKIEGYEVIPTMVEKLEGNTMYCATMQLAWNEISERFNEVKILEEKNITKNLDQKEFTKDMINEEDYIATSIIPTSKNLDKLKGNVVEKLGESSDVLKMIIPVPEDSNAYLFYSIILKNFEFEYAFKDLGEKEDKRYFGFNRHEDDRDILDQVEVLFYNDKDDFAIKLLTKGEEELYFYKSKDIDTFSSEFDEMISKEKGFEGKAWMTEDDYMKIPYMNFDEFISYDELEGVSFDIGSDFPYEVTSAIQTIKFELTNKGGKLKSEASIMVTSMAIGAGKVVKRDFICDEKFTMFLKDKGKKRPYLAIRMEE